MVETTTTSGRRPQYDLIWNLTRFCGWDCSICCVDAVQVDLKSKKTMSVRWDGLEKAKKISRDPKRDDIEVASDHLPVHLRELGLASKLSVLQNLKGESVRVDFSGGDPLIAKNNLKVIQAAGKMFGRQNVTITMTGRGITKAKIPDIASSIGEMNFSVDEKSVFEGTKRPKGYVGSNIALAARVAELGVKTRAELVLTETFLDRSKLYILLNALKEAGTGSILLMREFFVGRNHKKSSALKLDDYRAIIRNAREIQLKIDFPEIKLQCALRHIETDAGSLSENPCDLLAKSFGILPDGRVILSPWAIKRGSEPISPDWVIGDLTRTSLNEILESARVNGLRSRINSNFGHCKVFAFQNSKNTKFEDRLLDASDPLYVPELRSISVDPELS